MKADSLVLARILNTDGNIDCYHVPKYQREYKWGKNEWGLLLADIGDNEVGYFMGSIICISEKEPGPGESRIFEVVDGQQRLITLSIVLMSIYRYLLKLEGKLPQDYEDKRTSSLIRIKERLVDRRENGAQKDLLVSFHDKRGKYRLRVQPSTQNSNLDDYRHILNELKLIEENFSSNSCQSRALYKAYKYFCDTLPEDYEKVVEMLDRLDRLEFIVISALSYSNAFVLFESLNNKGIQLSAIDIIKNKMLSSLAKDMDKTYEEWQNLLDKLPEGKDQERFLRHYYNAFPKLAGFPKATKPNLIKIYERLIKENAQKILNDLIEKAEIYNYFIEPDESDLQEERKKCLLDLDRIGTPSYLFLLYLFSLSPEKCEDKEDVIDKILEFFLKYYVRRNITGLPPTSALDTINMEAIKSCDEYIGTGNCLSGSFIIKRYMDGKWRPSKIEDLEKSLEDNLFAENKDMARFVLSKLDETHHSREFQPNLWEQKKEKLVWTVEHIFPRGENIPQCWVEMIASGDEKKAKEIRKELVDCLGNLTLSGYNSTLSNRCFKDKQEKTSGKPQVGYKNGLRLNKIPFSVGGKETSLAEIDKWTETSIKARNKVMVDALVEMFAFDEAELNDWKKRKVQ